MSIIFKKYWSSAIYCAMYLFLFFFLFISPCYAVTLQISGAPSSINEEQEIMLNVLLNGSSSMAGKNYYLEGVFTKKDQAPSYFGWTQNQGGNWYSHGSNFSDFYKITLSSEASWSGSLKVKPDLSASSFKGSGEYYLKVFRYTESGSKSDEGNQLLLIINHQEQNSNPSPSPSPSPESTDSSPSPSPDISPSPRPIISPSPKALKKPSPSPSPEETNEATPSSIVLGIQNSASPTPSPENKPTKKIQFTLPVILSLTGGLLILSSGLYLIIPKIIAFRRKRLIIHRSSFK